MRIQNKVAPHRFVVPTQRLETQSQSQRKPSIFGSIPRQFLLEMALSFVVIVSLKGFVRSEEKPSDGWRIFLRTALSITTRWSSKCHGEHKAKPAVILGSPLEIPNFCLGRFGSSHRVQIPVQNPGRPILDR